MNSHGPNRHARVTIDLQAIRYNYQLLKEISGGKRLIAVVKADAYGHGAVEVTKALSKADAFAVASVGEAVALRKAGIKQRILVLGGFIRIQELQECIKHRLDPVIHLQTHLDYLTDTPDLKTIQLWIKVDSGMGRLGFQIDTVPSVMEQLARMPTLGQVRLMTHLASSDDVDNSYTDQQVAVVKSLHLNEYEWSIANSAGILAGLQEQQTWVRAGIAMYGANPMSNRKRVPVELKTTMQMKTSILAVNDHRKGNVIGYGSAYTCPRDMKVAVIAAGYGDGYPRRKIGTTQVSICGQACNIIGRISMDMITVDVSALETVKVDDDVTLFGEFPKVNDIADSSQTIAYEIFCNVGAHVKREYLNIDEN